MYLNEHSLPAKTWEMQQFEVQCFLWVILYVCFSLLDSKDSFDIIFPALLWQTDGDESLLKPDEQTPALKMKEVRIN